MSDRTFPIEMGHVMSFARAIGDPNPAYYGRQAIAPPTFVQASAQFDPNYHLRPNIGEPGARPASGTTPPPSRSPRQGPRLHAEQHFEYQRPIRVGEVLSVTTRGGETWEKAGRSGRLVFSEAISEYRDEAGELVVTARSVSVRTERATVAAS